MSPWSILKRLDYKQVQPTQARCVSFSDIDTSTFSTSEDFSDSSAESLQQSLRDRNNAEKFRHYKQSLAFQNRSIAIKERKNRAGKKYCQKMLPTKNLEIQWLNNPVINLSSCILSESQISMLSKG